MNSSIKEALVSKQNFELKRKKSNWKIFCRLAVSLRHKQTQRVAGQTQKELSQEAQSEVEWFNTSQHSIAKGFRVLKAMSDQIPHDELLQEHMRRAVLKARQAGLTNSQRQNLLATEGLWDQW